MNEWKPYETFFAHIIMHVQHSNATDAMRLIWTWHNYNFRLYYKPYTLFRCDDHFENILQKKEC